MGDALLCKNLWNTWYPYFNECSKGIFIKASEVLAQCLWAQTLSPLLFSSELCDLQQANSEAISI
ncbi:hypothetical protein GBA52_012443 [Prunus armeniaca]|nr:hypothetical protein GBA52_012443 [Prunus armeniaca]